jgi:ATP/maltotriose-dependent transcriptional regulator MalT
VRRTLARAEEVGNPRAECLCQQTLGAVLYLRGQWPAAESALRRSIDLARTFGGTFPEILGIQRLALLETAMGRSEIAQQRIREVLPRARESTNPMVRDHTPGRLLATAIRNRLEAGDLVAAEQYLALSSAEQALNGECPTCDVMLYPVAVPVYLARGDMAQAEQARQKADETALLFRSRAWSAAALSCRGQIAAARGDGSAAADSFTAALRIFEALDQPYDIARTLDALARAVAATPTPPVDTDVLRRRATAIYARLGLT